MRIVATLLAACFALPATAFGSDRFTDARGDADGGPDVTAVTISHSDAALTIAVEFAAAPPLAFDEGEQYTDMLLVGIHTDDDLRQRDVEFYTGVHAVDLTRAPVVQQRGARPDVVGNADVTIERTTVTLEVERALLGDPDDVAVAVAAGREYVDESAGGAGGGDMSPPSGAHPYTLTGDGGAPPLLWVVVAVALAAAVLGAFAVPTVGRRPVGHLPAAS